MFRCCVCLVAILVAAPAVALDQVVLRRDDRELAISGKVLVTAQDGGLLLLAPDGELWTIEPGDLVSHKSDDAPFVPLSADQLAARLRSQLPPGFEVHTTAHYVICYNTSRAYAQWCGALFERLYRAFTNYWGRKGFALHEPELPLAALIFSERSSYQRFSKGELGDAAGAIIGFYSLKTNRVTMYDLTGVEALRQPESGRGSPAEINRMLSQPAAEPMVATIIHEATHQIAFNCGLQTRFADIPLWVSEGIAVYFETPDLSSAKGWRGIGEVNRPRLATFREEHPQRRPGQMETLIADDKRFRDPKTALAAYADAWALNYYLLKQRPKEYVAFLQVLSHKNQLVWDDRAARLAEFRKFFGHDLDTLDRDVARQMSQLK